MCVICVRDSTKVLKASLCLDNFYFRGQVLQLPDNNGPPLPHLLTGRMNNLILTEVDDQQKQRLQNFLDIKKKLGEPKSDDDVRKL